MLICPDFPKSIFEKIYQLLDHKESLETTVSPAHFCHALNAYFIDYGDWKGRAILTLSDLFQALHLAIRDRTTQEKELQGSYNSCVYDQVEISQLIECHYKGYLLRTWHNLHNQRDYKTLARIQEAIKAMFNGKPGVFESEGDLSQLDLSVWSALKR